MSNMTELEAIDLAKKALKDIGHWENFKIEKARYLEPGKLADYAVWGVSFYFSDKDWLRGERTPTLLIDDVKKIVTFVSWHKSEFLLRYNKNLDKYWHPELSR